MPTKFEIKKFKSQMGHEGPGFFCHLYVDGVKGAEAIDQGDGGMVYWTWFDQEAKRKFEAHVASLPEREYGEGMEGTYKPDADTAIVDLIAEFETRKTFTRKCKTKTLFRLKGQKPEEYYEMKVAFTSQVAENLRRKHGDNLAEIINETVMT